jgi:hypothetical protein
LQLGLTATKKGISPMPWTGTPKPRKQILKTNKSNVWVNPCAGTDKHDGEIKHMRHSIQLLFKKSALARETDIPALVARQLHA